MRHQNYAQQEKLRLLEEQLEVKKKLLEYLKFNKIERYFPEEGPLSRHNYPKHMDFFKAGLTHRLRAFIAANRIGKTASVGGFELTNHLLNRYPTWWKGKVFKKPINAWACGKTNLTVRDILQEKLIGPTNALGTGNIPKRFIKKVTPKRGIPDAIESAEIWTVNNEVSYLDFKSYEQGRKAFEGTEQDLILLDEEPPMDVYAECLIRLMTTNGHLLMTFTPLDGMTEVIMEYLHEGKHLEDDEVKYVVTAGWDDAPHLSEQQKKELLATIPEYQKEARTKGIPQLGSGAIYPISEEEIVVDPFEIPEHWPKGYGLDVGWNCTAAVWAAHDRETDIIYLYHEYKAGKKEPELHASAIKSPGEWITGAIDPAARGRAQKDGLQLLKIYQDLGLKIVPADNSREAGIFDVYQRLTTGKLKVFKTLRGWLEEFRLYRRDDDGKIVKRDDHLMDATRYIIKTKSIMRIKDFTIVSKDPVYDFYR
ncbi:MAG TPA: terminase family protein [Bacteroidia bacterium]|nr:terminase family protein [Bacteroidia bacterium]